MMNSSISNERVSSGEASDQQDAADELDKRRPMAGLAARRLSLQLLWLARCKPSSDGECP